MRQTAASSSGSEVYTEVSGLAKKRMTEMLVRMIDSADEYYGWSLSDQDGQRVVKLLRHKQRIICSSFSFQLSKHFNDFKADKDPATSVRDWNRLGLPGAIDPRETEELTGIAERYDEAFREFDRSILKRLQTCIKRSRANIYENPLQVRRLCECFQYAIDSLNLAMNYKLALYYLFADRFIEALGPLYRSIDRFLLERGMQPELAPARILLRNGEDLSESEPPETFVPDQSASLLILLQRFKEKSRQASAAYKNLFPELKQRFGQLGLTGHNEEIDQLNGIFKLIFEDVDLPVPVKQQLARLQIYVFITAIQEEDFLRRSSNPARRLLDEIIKHEVEIARGENPDFSGIKFIREYIDELASRQFITIESYSEMLDAYLEYLTDHEAATRKARREEATRKIMPVVSARLSELTHPLEIQGTSLILFEKVWLPLMVQIALQKGMDSDAWHKTIAMVQRLVWSLIPKSTLEEQAELLEAQEPVAHSLHRAMRSLKLAEKLQQSLRDYFSLQQQDVAEKTTQNIVDAKRRTRSLGAQSFGTFEDSTEFDAMMQTGVFQVPKDMLEAMNAKKSEPKRVNLIETLNIGDWFNFRKDGQTSLVKLKWKAEDSSLFIFVDRDGSPVCEIDAEELSSKLDGGDLSTLESGTADSEKTQFSFLKTL